MTTPPPSPALLASLDDMTAVRPRSPARALLVVALVACAYPAWTLAQASLHAPLKGVGVAALWLAGFIASLYVALVPARGQVIPDTARALRVALVSAAALLVASILGAARSGHAPSSGSLPSWRACLIFSLEVAVPTIIAGAVALRRVALVPSWRLGAALGAAGGALAGLTLHFTHAPAGPGHMALAHGGGVVLGLLLGALTAPLLLRRAP